MTSIKSFRRKSIISFDERIARNFLSNFILIDFVRPEVALGLDFYGFPIPGFFKEKKDDFKILIS